MLMGLWCLIIDKESGDIIRMGRTKALMRIYNLKNEQEISNYVRQKCPSKLKATATVALDLRPSLKTTSKRSKNK